jgi:CO/xanthine dehydrogenase FAD-binding subunit
VKPPKFDYAAPESLDEATRLLADDDEAKVLAGGQSLLPLLNFRLAAPSLLVDLRRIRGLDAIERGDGGIRLGAMVTQRAAEDDESLLREVPLLREALRFVAHPQIRSRGTVVGSIAHADPAAELPALLVALDARVHVRSTRGTRSVDAADLYDGYFTTSLEPGELMTSIELPAAAARTGAACVEVVQRAGDYALCGAVVQVTRSAAGEIEDVRVGLLGVGQRPARAAAVEERLRGESPTAQLLAEAATHAADGISPADDRQATAEYRRHLSRVLVRRGLEQALERAA